MMLHNRYHLPFIHRSFGTQQEAGPDNGRTERAQEADKGADNGR